MVSRARRHQAEKESVAGQTERLSAEEILRRVDRALAQAEDGLSALLARAPNERTPDASGLRDVAVYGHATTMVLKKLRGVDRTAFDEWWTPIRERIAADPLMRFFYGLRSEILKEGGPAAYEFVIHRTVIRMTDDLEPSFETAGSVRFSGTPTEHCGQPITDLSIPNVCRLYVEALREIVRDAHARFGSSE